MVEPLSLSASVNALIAGVKRLLDHKAASQFSSQLIELLKLSQEIQEQNKEWEEKLDELQKENEALKEDILRLRDSKKEIETAEGRMEELHEKILFEIAQRPGQLNDHLLQEVFNVPSIQVSHALNTLYERELLSIEPGNFYPSQRATNYLAKHGLLVVSTVPNLVEEEVSPDELKVLKALAMQPNGSSMQFVMGTVGISLAKAKAIYSDLQKRGLTSLVVKTNRKRPVNPPTIDS